MAPSQEDIPVNPDIQSDLPVNRDLQPGLPANQDMSGRLPHPFHHRQISRSYSHDHHFVPKEKKYGVVGHTFNYQLNLRDPATAVFNLRW